MSIKVRYNKSLNTPEALLTSLLRASKPVHWEKEERIIVTDEGLDHLGTPMADYLSFQWQIAEAGSGRVDLVLGLEVSQLAQGEAQEVIEM